MAEENIITTKELKKAGGTKGSFPFAILLFAAFSALVVIQAVLLWKHHSVSVYNVQTPAYDNITGSVRGVVLRNEEVLSTDQSGYVTLYKQDGDWLSEGETVLLQSPEFHLSGQLSELCGENRFSAASLKKISETMRNAAGALDTEDFDTVLELKSDTMEAVFSRLLTDNTSFESYLKTVSVSRKTTENSGFYMSWTDGWEILSMENLTSAMLRGENYSRLSLRSGDYKTASETIGKIACDNSFKIVFLIEDAAFFNYARKTQLTIRTEDGLEITGAFETGVSADGKHTGILSFQKYGAQFLSGRFVNFAVLDKQVFGYKIPESSIIHKNFFVVPESFVTVGGAESKPGLMVYQNGDFQHMACTVYRVTEDSDASIVKEEGYCYVYAENLSPGTRIHNDNSSGAGEEEMVIGQEIPVEGVFQVNSGYCVFKPVSRIQNSLDTAYVLVSSKTQGTVKPYDRILLNAAEFSENEFLFE